MSSDLQKFSTSTYTKYAYITSDIQEVFGKIEQNALDFTTKFESGEVTKGQLSKIARELESAAVYFGEQQGLSGSNLIKIGNTGIHADIHGKYINFKNSAVDKYNRFYAGHIEYGHYTKNRKGFVPARPFMRPALYAVSKASVGELGDVLSDMLMTIFRGNGNGYNGITNLEFGNQLGSLYRYSQYSNEVVSKLTSQNIGEYSTGKDLNLQRNFEKRMSSWSLKRHSNSKLQNRMKKSEGFSKSGLSSLGQRQYLSDYYKGRGSVYTNQAKTFGFHRAGIDLKKEQEKMANTLRNKKNAKKRAMRTGRYPKDSDEKPKSRYTDTQRRSLYKSEKEKEENIAKQHRELYKGLNKIDKRTKIDAEGVKNKAALNSIIDRIKNYRYRKNRLTVDLELRKKINDAKKAKKFKKDGKSTNNKNKNTQKVKRVKFHEIETKTIKVYPTNPALIPEEKRAGYLKTMYTEQRLTKEQLENSRYKHYTKDMYY